MTNRVAVIDYGMGNLRSVSKAIEHVAGEGAEVRVTDDPEWILAADRVVFPGQGAARDCMSAIGEHHLNSAVLEAARHKPFFGICMGLQVLVDYSDENDGTVLLGLLRGRVIRFANDMSGSDGLPLKIPHMGWNGVNPMRPHPLWEGIGAGERFYFVHSYHVVPDDPAMTSATTDYGVTFTSAVARDNLFAVQFHPEKSADAGLRLLANFIGWNP